MKMFSVSCGVLISGVLFASVATAQDAGASQAAGAPRPAIMRPPPPLLPFEANIARGATIVARWDLTPDSTNTRYVLAQTRSAEGHIDCVIAAVVNNAWVIDRRELSTDTDAPNLCFSAIRVANRWVFAKWNLGGYGDGARRVNESQIELVALVQGRFARVHQSDVTSYTLLFSGAQLVLPVTARRNAVLSWAADGNSLVEARPARPPIVPRR